MDTAHPPVSHKPRRPPEGHAHDHARHRRIPDAHLPHPHAHRAWPGRPTTATAPAGAARAAAPAPPAPAAPPRLIPADSGRGLGHRPGSLGGTGWRGRCSQRGTRVRLRHPRSCCALAGIGSRPTPAMPCCWPGWPVTTTIVAVTVPTPGQESARDLVRAREDARMVLMSARHRLSKLLLRHGSVYDEQAWTGRHDAWLRRVRREQPRVMSASSARTGPASQL